LRSQGFEDARLSVVKAREFPLSGQDLLDLMQAVLARGVPFRFCARGWSMTPFIHDGDVITVSPLHGALPGVGEVVAFARPGTGNPVVHRVIARCGTGSLIQGDSMEEYTDGIIPAENLLGRVTRVERRGHDIWLGLGPERYVIAWLSRAGLLRPLSRVLPSWLKKWLQR